MDIALLQLWREENTATSGVKKKGNKFDRLAEVGVRFVARVGSLKRGLRGLASASDSAAAVLLALQH